jgi:hypothetical protein
MIASLLLGAAATTDPKPNWPESFFANFTETMRTAKGTGYYALDMSYDNGKVNDVSYCAGGLLVGYSKEHS